MFEPPQEISFQDAQAQYDTALARASLGWTKYPGSSYEQGVAAALGWLLQELPEPPLSIEEEG